MNLKFLVLLSLWCITYADGAKILGVLHNPSRSHFILGSTLLEALAQKGHDVTMLSPYPFETNLKNLEVIEFHGLQLSKDAVVKRVRTVINGTMYDKFRSMQENYKQVAEVFLNHITFKEFLNSNRQYDMVIIDWVFNDAYLAIADHFKAHSVILNGIGSSSNINKITRNPSPNAYVTNILPVLSDEMTLFQRFLNTWGKILFEFVEIYQKYTQNRLIRQHFPSAPDVAKLYGNVSLILLNSHFTVETPRPYIPNMVPIGGFHIKEPKQLEKELKTFLDNATEGVVYFSFGSAIKSADLGPYSIQMLIRAFAKLPMKVLWKFESDDLPKLPPNVKTGKWLPQNDILAHPNVKVFVSHGGLLSMLETIHHGVPILAVPFFGDQEANVEIAVRKGYGKKLSFHDLNEGTFETTIVEIVNNPKYRKNIKERSKWYRDRPMKPLDTAIYWIEYVLRHNGAHHLKTAAVKLSWYQYYLLDVIVLFVILILVSVFILKKLAILISSMKSKGGKIIPKKFL